MPFFDGGKAYSAISNENPSCEIGCILRWYNESQSPHSAIDCESICTSHEISPSPSTFYDKNQNAYSYGGVKILTSAPKKCDYSTHTWKVSSSAPHPTDNSECILGCSYFYDGVSPNTSDLPPLPPKVWNSDDKLYQIGIMVLKKLLVQVGSINGRRVLRHIIQ